MQRTNLVFDDDAAQEFKLAVVDTMLGIIKRQMVDCTDFIGNINVREAKAPPVAAPPVEAKQPVE